RFAPPLLLHAVASHCAPTRSSPATCVASPLRVLPRPLLNLEGFGRMTFDVCIVGAGPSGATCAWYRAKAGKKVLLLEKRKFPRDKICGDAVCLNAQNHMAKMGVLQELEAEKKGN